MGSQTYVAPVQDSITIQSSIGLPEFPVDAFYDNRFISVVTIENRKIVRWRDYMDSLAARTALSGSG
jgi:hypothetical protein